MASTEYLIANNLKALMREEGLNISDLARKLEIKPPIVHRLLTGENNNPTLTTLKLFSDYFKISVGQLIGEVELIPRWLHKKTDDNLLNSMPLVTQSTFNGIISENKIDFVMKNISLSEKAFAMKITKNNMNPAVPENAIVIIEPTLKPSNNTFVLVKENGAYIVKLYITKGENVLLLTSFNDFNTITEISSKNKIVGTIIRVIYGVTVTDS